MAAPTREVIASKVSRRWGGVLRLREFYKLLINPSSTLPVSGSDTNSTGLLGLLELL